MKTTSKTLKQKNKLKNKPSRISWKLVVMLVREGSMKSLEMRMIKTTMMTKKSPLEK